jgi:hypothetical protein
MPPNLDVIDGPAKGQRIEVKVGETLTVGRSDAAMITIGDPEMAPVHFHIGVVNGRLALHTLPDSAVTLVNGSPVHSAILGDGDRVQAGATSLIVVAPGRTGYPAKVWIGGWGFASVPAGWNELGGIGFQLTTEKQFKPTITAFEERLPEGQTLLEYVGAQTDLVTSQIPNVSIEAPMTIHVVGAEEAFALELTIPTPDGRVVQRQAYALAAGIVAVLTATTLEDQIKSFEETWQSVFRDAFYCAKN